MFSSTVWNCWYYKIGICMWISSQISVIFGIQHDWRDPISGVYVSSGSAETLAREGGITNQHLIAYSLCNISAKNYKNRLMCVEVTVCYISVVFLRHSLYIVYIGAICQKSCIKMYLKLFIYYPSLSCLTISVHPCWHDTIEHGVSY